MRLDVYQNAAPDESLKLALISAFEDMSIARDIADKLSKIILQLIVNRNNGRNCFDNSPSIAEHIVKLDAYIDSLSSARKALLALPLMTQEVLAEMSGELDFNCTLLDGKALSTLFCPMYDNKSNLPEWRLKGLSHIERWGAEVELLDLMKACAVQWRDKHISKAERRDGTHIGMIANIAKLCGEHGITMSHTPRSHFMKIMVLVFPNLSSPRAAIGEAAKLLAK